MFEKVTHALTQSVYNNDEKVLLTFFRIIVSIIATYGCITGIYSHITAICIYFIAILKHMWTYKSLTKAL